MVKSLIVAAAAIAALGVIAIPAVGLTSGTAKSHVAKAGAAIGQPAPTWSLSDTKGVEHSLSDYAGKYVVLEWTNKDCPFVKKHYNSGNMQSLQKYATGKGAVWFSVISSGPEREGFLTAEEAESLKKSQKSHATATLFDTEGKVGRAYNAKTTPDMMIINPKGVLIYSGGIDDKPTADPEDVKTAHNYVRAALDEAMAGKPVTVSTSQPYGCGVKYPH